jgi:hypothetical protein
MTLIRCPIGWYRFATPSGKVRARFVYSKGETIAGDQYLFYTPQNQNGTPEAIFPIDDESPTGWDQCMCGMANDAPKSDGSCAFVDGSYVIDCQIDGTDHDCTVDGADLDGFFTYPNCIKLEGAQINLAESGPYWYRLDGMQSGEFLYTLGLRNGDRPYEINSYPLTTR